MCVGGAERWTRDDEKDWMPVSAFGASKAEQARLAPCTRSSQVKKSRLALEKG